MNKVKRITLLVIVTIVVVCFLSIAYRMTTNTTDTTAVVKEIRTLNRWETSSFTVEKIIDAGTNGNVFQQILFGNKILLIAHGEVIGGFDLSQFSQQSVTVHGSAIQITLPAPLILASRIDNSKTKVYDRQKGLLVPSNDNLESEALSTAQKSIQEAACSEDILGIASSNAKSQLTSMLAIFGFKTITITIPAGHCQ